MRRSHDRALGRLNVELTVALPIAYGPAKSGTWLGPGESELLACHLDVAGRGGAGTLRSYTLLINALRGR